MANIVFNKWKYKTGPVEILFGETTPEDNIDFLFEEPAYPSPSEIEFVFGETGEAPTLILGEGSAVVEVTSVGEAESEFDGAVGNGSVVVEVTTNGTGSTTIVGNGTATVEVTSTGTAYITQDINGNSDITVDVISTGLAQKDIWGDSDVSVEVESTGAGVLILGDAIVGTSDITVEVTSVGEIQKSLWGDSDITVEVTSEGFAVYNLEGNSDVTVEVVSSGTAQKEIWGDSNISVDVISTGSGYREIWGSSTNVVAVESFGASVLTGGFPIDGNHSTTITVSSTGTGRILLPISGLSNITVSVLTSGTGEAKFIYPDLFGYSNVTVEVGAPGAASMPAPMEKTYLIPKIDIDYSEILFESNIFVDIDTGEFEVRDIITNRPFLKKVYIDKQTEHMSTGTKSREKLQFAGVDSPGVYLSRRIDIRRFGPSIISFKVNITPEYRFFKNQISIEETITRLIDRGILDAMAQYEVEYD